MQKEDLKQIRDLFREELELSTSKMVTEVTDKVVNEIGGIISAAFSEFEAKTNARFDAIEKQLDLKPSIAQFQHWADENIAPVQLDVDRLKYINRDEMKELPTQLEISETLIQEGIN